MADKKYYLVIPALIGAVYLIEKEKSKSGFGGGEQGPSQGGPGETSPPKQVPPSVKITSIEVVNVEPY